MSPRSNTTRRQRLAAAAIAGFIEGAIIGFFEWRNDAPTK